tara:strand:- start:1046 stop:1339 length:294 start_codon:yes stop_codon:yes gene_type:complete
LRKRISIKDTRAIIDAILDNSIEHHPTSNLPIFNLVIPQFIDGVDARVLAPRNSYQGAQQWQLKAQDLASQSISNFVKFTDVNNGKALLAAGPQLNN